MRALLVSLALLLGSALAQATDGLPVYSFKVVNTYPHDPQAFTEGLFYAGGFLYEGTGLNGRSELRKVELQTGRVVQRRTLDPKYFGEGIALFQGRFYQMTWQNGIGFLYDASFNPVGSFRYETEGWGLTTDGKTLIQSDGSATLYFRDANFKVLKTLTVTAEGKPVEKLNELEYIRGKIYANVWETNRIAIINPSNGKVEAWLDLSGLALLVNNPDPNAVLNGIAYDAASDRLWVTGKLWPYIFEIKVVGR
ncbi:glutaminyl-peptide cyclotransferase [Meiothermus granaticius]|uniref:Glutamine cyclotransferase n=1 Tax=Meiothermus granaticius NBRC 107808 TaxID=1227551 RepID=A0A399F8S0_9DEIN|nr:glutaminyl-peptide cyclotransferase [Meiothermus granaticius]RIH91031.1 Glutamine cyclotransferase [Meiothermus granaticius NBRC 107808]GEM85931.1 glutaminyl-peptide cyclotransferase [Meiothermus granaticius NBRC 107808]